MTQSEKVKIVARVLKKQLNVVGGMTNEEAIVLAHKIIEALEKPPSKVEVKPNGPTS